MDGRAILMLGLKLPQLCRAKGWRLHAESFRRLFSEIEAIDRGPSPSTWRTVAQVPIEQVLQDESLPTATAGVSTSKMASKGLGFEAVGLNLNRAF